MRQVDGIVTSLVGRKHPTVVITMPAFRAAGTLAKTVAEIPAGISDAIILVDDASPDNTVELARELGITVYAHPENRGYGGNQKTCYTRALAEGADIVVLLHPDYQYDPKTVPLLIAPIVAGQADMTFGSRFAGLGDPRGGGMPLYRFLGNRVTTTLENLMLGSRFTDLHSGLRRNAQVPPLASVPALHGRLQLRLAAPGRRGHERAAGRRGPDSDPLHGGVFLDLGRSLARVRRPHARLLRAPGGGPRPPRAPVAARTRRPGCQAAGERSEGRAALRRLRLGRARPSLSRQRGR